MKLVPVRLRDLVLTQEITTTLTRRKGIVAGTGWTLWDDGTGRTVRLRAVRVRYQDGSEKIHPAEMFVLVPETTAHCRFSGSELGQRWSNRLADPDSMGTVGELAIAKRKRAAGDGERRAPC